MTKRFPLMPTQSLLTLSELLLPGSGTMTGVLTAPEEVDGGALREAVGLVVARHEALRTAIERSDLDVEQTEPEYWWRTFEQVVRPEVDVTPCFLEGDPVSRQRVKLALDQPPALRVRLHDDRRTLTVTTNHAISDHWSFDVLVRDLHQLYLEVVTGRPARIPVLTTKFTDFVEARYAAYRAGATERHLQFWMALLGDVHPPVSPVPKATFGMRVDRAAYRVMIRGAEHKAVAARLRVHRTSAFTMAMAALATALGQHFPWPETLIAVPVANRARREQRDVIGLYANMAFYPVPLQGDPDELVDHLRDLLLSSARHWHVVPRAVFTRLDPEVQERIEAAPRVCVRELGAGPRTLGLAESYESRDEDGPVPPSPDYGLGADLMLDVDARSGDGSAALVLSYRRDLIADDDATKLAETVRDLLVGVPARSPS